ncbi:MAG: transcriptional activator [Chthonomonadales bacterium]|nr:transcriptional activator [Chthonomonadales bacterium]
MQTDLPSKHRESPLILRLFGPFDARRNGEPLPPLRSRRGHWVLALLALRQGRAVEREWLAGTLWPDSLSEQALYNLRRTLSDLRQALGTAASCLHSPTPHSLQLDLSGAEVDVTLFDEAIARPEQASLERAIALYRGPLLEGCPEAWALQERQAREETYLRALERLAAYAIDRKDTSEAVRYLRLAVGVDALRESVQCRLMEALALGGDPVAAMQVYRELRLLLMREVNAQPDAETRGVYERLRAEAQQRATLRPRHTPDNLTPVNNLPKPLTSFIGRDREIAEITTLLTTTRLLTLTGAGGCGKTRLALQVALETLEQYPEGVWLIELAPLLDSSLVPHSVAEGLGIREAPGVPILRTLLTALKNKQMLLILDNCEHLLEAAAHLADSLLKSCSHSLAQRTGEPRATGYPGPGDPGTGSLCSRVVDRPNAYTGSSCCSHRS